MSARTFILVCYLERRLYLNPVRAKPIPPMNRIKPMKSRLPGLPKGRIKDKTLARNQKTMRTKPRVIRMTPCTISPRSIFTRAGNQAGRWTPPST